MRRLANFGLVVSASLNLLLGGGLVYCHYTGRHVTRCLGRVHYTGHFPVEVWGPPVSVGTSVNPFAHLDFSVGNWDAYLVLDDEYGHPDLSSNLFRLREPGVLRSLQREMTTVVSGGYVATVSSRIVLLRDGQVVYWTRVVLRGRELLGFQTSAFGFLKVPHAATVSRSLLEAFDPVCDDMVVLQ